MGFVHKWDFARLFYWFFLLWYCFIHKEDRVSVALQFQDHKGLDNNILLTQCLDNNPKRILIYSPSIICTFVHKCHHLVYSIFCKISGVLCCWFQCCQLLHMISRKNYNWVKMTQQCGNFMIFLSLRFYVKSILDNL